MPAAPLYLSLAKAEFAYEATNEEELSVEEDQLVWVIEDADTDPDWFKVKIKSTDPSAGTGLVPASYLTAPTPLRNVTAVYDYAPALTDSGEPENEEEIEIVEGEVLVLYEDEGDWVLVGRTGTKGVGFVPGSYVEAEGEGGQVAYEEEEEPAPPPVPQAPPAPYVDPSERVAASKSVAKPGDVKTWAVTEVDKKKKKKKGTLGVGNGAVFFASDADKTPVQQYLLSTLTDLTTEKSKHLHLTFPTIGELHFVIASPDTFKEILAKIEDGRGAAPSPSVPTARTLPPDPAAAGYNPPPPPMRSNSSAAIPPPPVRTASASASNGSSKANAVALYDFEPEGADELAVTEGERLIYIEGGSDDADWVKVRKVGSSNKEGVVPSSYVQIDGEGDGAAEQDPSDDEESRAAAEAEAKADAADKARLAAELQAAERARRQKVAADREAKEKKAKDEEARKRRLQEQPKAAPIPVPDREQLDDGAPPLAARPGKERSEKKALSKPSPKRVRTWKDRTGQFKVEAEFLGMNGNKIRLHKLNGVTIEVPMEKMSPEDLSYLKKLNSRSSIHADDNTPLAREAQEQRRNERHAHAMGTASGSDRDASRSRSKSTQGPKKPAIDWFEFFLNAGCDMDDCTRYARNFDNEKIEESLVPDLESSTLRTLGLREGDIIRVLKHIKDKYAPPPTPEKGDREAQMASDAAMARQLAGAGPTPPPPNLFTNADGGLKPRRGRPGRSGTGGVDADALKSATSELAKRTATPPIARVASPPAAVSAASTGGSTLDPPKRSSSTIPQLGGFDDDAWAVKEPAKAAPPPAAPTPPPAPPAPAAAAAPPAAAAPQRAGSADPSTAGLTYNDGLLAQLNIGPRPPSAPAPGAAQPMQMNGTGYSQFNPNGPRGPVAPIAANQALLAPLIPTPTGFGGIRPQFGQPPLMPNMTGYPGIGQAPLMPSFTGMPMQSQATGFNGMMAPSPMQMQPTGFVQQQPSFLQPQQTSFMQPQATGYLQPQATGIFQQQPQQAAPSPQPFNPAPARFSPAPNVQFNPQPPAASTAPSGSGTSAQFQPNNIFASMKDGSFAQGGSKMGPQDAGKYDALRPQQTGFVGQQQPLQAQATGVFAAMQPQMTGFPGQQQQQQPMYPQQTGMPMQFNQFQQRQF